MGQQLIRGHVLPSSEQLTGCHLVQDCGQLVVTGQIAQHVVFKAVDALLQPSAVLPDSPNLVARHHRHRVREFDTCNLVGESAMRCRGHVARERLDSL